MKLQLIKAQNNLTKNLKKQFDIPYVPDEKALLSFLTQLKLDCFLKENVAVKHAADVFDENNKLLRILLCLPPSKSLSEEFVMNLCTLLKQASCPVVLYWPWKISEKVGYVALRLILMRKDKTIELTIEVVHPLGVYFGVTPVDQIVRQLKTQLTDYEINVVKSPKIGKAITGDALHWAAFSLLLSIMGEVKEYNDKLNLWLLEQQNKQHDKPLFQWQYAAKGVLNTMPYLDSRLFYTEQCLAVLNMPLLHGKLAEFSEYDLIPWWIQDTRFHTLLRTMVLANIVYQQDYTKLLKIPIICLLNSLTDYLLQRVSKQPSTVQGFTTLILRLLTKSLLIIFSLSPWLFFNEMQRAITAPRYVLLFFQGMLKGIIDLLLNIPSALLMVLMMEKMFQTGKTEEGDSDDAKGIFAIAVLAAEYLTSFVHVEVLSPWEGNQEYEEVGLNYLNKGCDEDCKLEITSPLTTRIGQHIIGGNQTVNLELEISNHTENCSLHIKPEHKPEANTTRVDYELVCQSNLFRKKEKNPFLIESSITGNQSFQNGKF